MKNVHPVSGPGIQTHDLLDVSLVSLPLDQSYRQFLLNRLLTEAFLDVDQNTFIFKYQT